VSPALSRVGDTTLRAGAHATAPSGQRRNCFTIPAAPRRMDALGGTTAAETPPCTKYQAPRLDVSSRHERSKGGTIAPLPKPKKKPTGADALQFAALTSFDETASPSGAGRSRRARNATPEPRVSPRASPSPDLWKRPDVARDDEAGLIAVLKAMPTDKSWTAHTSAWSATPVDRSAGIRRQLGTALQTPPPGKYQTEAPQMGGAATRGGKLSRAPRFEETPAARATPGPGAYNQSTAPRRANSRGVDFSKAPGGRCMGGGSFFVCKRSATAVDAREIGGGGDLANLLAPGPGAYNGAADARAAFRTGHGSAGGDLSPVAASFLAQRIPFDRSQLSPAVISDIVHVRTVAEDIARYRLRA